MRTRSALLAASLAALVQGPATGHSSEIRIFSANGMREVMEDLGPKFERAAGHKLTISFATVGVIVQRISSGESADLVIIPQQGVDRLIKDGKAGASTTVARSGIGIVIRKGAPRPDVTTPEALKQSFLAAKSITYLDPKAGGTSGVHFMKVLDRLGISDQIKLKTLLHPSAKAAGEMVARGDAEIGINLIQELLPLPGIELVGPLPGDLQLTLVYAAAIMNDTKEATPARALVDFLRTPAAAAAIKAKGMETN